eukprot:TRINITY_DN777910_c0_g1_i1.p1 TRINITY_DN777910_c0_g1~~TRINITY_DN777910_c0_g1_i1.p1  ORF type:complete len:264 (-),score=23.99 TRINITY_DN777910_c0_g1_i1:150-941(-)
MYCLIYSFVWLCGSIIAKNVTRRLNTTVPQSNWRTAYATNKEVFHKIIHLWFLQYFRSGPQASNMRAIVQRVKKASVSVDGEVISSIGPGLMVLCGISTNSTEEDEKWIVSKILTSRLFDDEVKQQRWKKSVMTNDFEVLCVSQFTLYGYMKGTSPDFHCSMKTEEARAAFDSFVARMKTQYRADKIFEGRFGTKMSVEIVNDGPVTMVFDSVDRKPNLPVKKEPKKIKAPKVKKMKCVAKGENKSVDGIEEKISDLVVSSEE